MAAVQWLPLESNPDVMNKFLENLGVSSKWSISDVISLDEELLPLIPAPVLAFLLLFPVGPVHDECSKKQQDEMLASGLNVSDKLYFMKQTIRNACGTVALIHSVANNVHHLNMDKSSTLLKFLESTKPLSPEERGKELEKNVDIGAAHEVSAQEGQTETPGADEDINLHFITFVNIEGHLYELDGRKDIPISHGPTSEDTFVKDASKVCKAFMQRDPENVKFTILALGPSTN